METYRGGKLIKAIQISGARGNRKKPEFKKNPILNQISNSKWNIRALVLRRDISPSSFPFFHPPTLSFSRIPRGVFREGDSTRQKQTTDITSYRWILRVLLYGRLSMKNFQGRSENDCENNFGFFHSVISTRCDNLRLSALSPFFPSRYSPSSTWVTLMNQISTSETIN